MAHIEIYATATCPYCVRARRLLLNKGVEFEEIRVDLEIERRAEMERRSQRHTVPQIFIDGHHVGGCDDLHALDEAGELDPMLGLECE
jgi:glutaredoxin 3